MQCDPVLAKLCRSHKFNAVDLQNATLAGGVIVGTVADLPIQPYGAGIAGSIGGIVATVGYQFIQVGTCDRCST